MWTHRYLPGRRPLFLLLMSGILLSLLTGLLLSVRHHRCGRRAARPAIEGALLRLSGTQGACVRIDGRTVGPLPLEISFSVREPRAIFVEACQDDYLEQAAHLTLLPGQLTTLDLTLSESPTPRRARCACQAPR